MAEVHATDQVQGTCLVVGAATVFALVALVVNKDPAPVLGAMECRFVVSWLLFVAVMFKFHAERGLYWFGPPELRVWLLLKCAVTFTFITLWWTALRFAPIGDCIAIIYASPILTSLLSRMFLKELLPCQFPCQVLMVSFGTLLVQDPPFVRRFFVSNSATMESQADYTFLWLAVVACSLQPIVTRKAKDCSWIEVEHVSACLNSTILCPALIVAQSILYGSTPAMPSQTPTECGIIVLAGVGSFVGIAMETKGYQLAEVGKASMFRFVEVPFAYILQHLGTDAPVTLQAVFGSTLIVASCFLNFIWAEKTTADATQEVDQKKQALLGA